MIDEAVKTAVFRKLDATMPSFTDSPEEIQKGIDHLLKVRAWAEALPPGDIREAYLYYIKYYEHVLPERRRESLSYERSRTITVPPPPPRSS